VADQSERPIVALVTDAVFPYHRGGKEIRYHEVARRLAGHADVHVYTMNWWRGERVRREHGVTFHAITPFLPLYVGERRSIKQALVFALGCLRLMFRRFDVLEADHMPYMQLFPLRLVASLRRKRLVVTWHEFWGRDYWREYLGRPGRVGWWLERLAMRLPDEIIAASAQTADRLRAHLGDRAAVTVAPNGVDLDLIRDTPAAADTTDLVVVGRLLDHKRIDLLIDALARLHTGGMPLTCRVIGDGPQRDSLRRRAEERGIAHAIDFRHDVEDARTLYSLLKSARAFAFPSAREGFGIAVLEALACGLPVVTTSAPDNLARHLVARSSQGIVCAPDPDAFAAAIQAVLARTSGAAAERAGEEWLREFDWQSVTDRVAGVVLG
jgi:glycosyltransferase involved in cell wall biosynthesis